MTGDVRAIGFKNQVAKIQKGIMHIDECEGDFTPLGGAIAFDSLYYAKRFIKMGANPNKQDKDGLVPLCFCQTHEQVDLLVTAGANVNYQNNKTGQTPLYCATYYGYPEAIEALLNYGADMHCQCLPRKADCRASIVHAAPFVALRAYGPKIVDILRLYKKHGYNLDGVNGDGSLLHACVLRGDVVTMGWLLKQKIDKKITNMHGRSALEQVEYLFQTNEWAMIGYGCDNLKEMRRLLK